MTVLKCIFFCSEFHRNLEEWGQSKLDGMAPIFTNKGGGRTNESTFNAQSVISSTTTTSTECGVATEEAKELSPTELKNLLTKAICKLETHTGVEEVIGALYQVESQDQTITMFITPYDFPICSPDKICGAVLRSIYETTLQSPIFKEHSIINIYKSQKGKATVLEISPTFAKELKKQEWHFLLLDPARSNEPVCNNRKQSSFHNFVYI